ncbi:NlpC/P60 family protein [Bacillus sp. FJAT-42376]|uniref:NlpC/P60 family protein n=1 Tax=Bacillus sp. FJAT-42376 TaxID=2014076 RepID=UPI000F516C60|nr:NlpC/P60 family protein [Bacillus sp. FJAT-42376]AZB44571.1 NlpC/P60 family protein [Bacillus sp. FJAT-42376]
MKKPIIALGLATSLLFSSYLPANDAKAASTSFETNIINISKQYIGVPYKWGGTTPAGFDCSGFINYVFNKTGISMPRTADGMYNSSSMEKVSSKEVGDIVFFRTMDKPTISHAGIYIGSNQFIHASSSKGVTISSLSERYWSNAYVSTKRHSMLGSVMAAEAENYAESAKDLWNNLQAKYSSSSKISGLDSSLIGEYNRLKAKSKDASFTDYMTRSAWMIDSVKNGLALEKQTNEFTSKLIEGQRLDAETNKLYDDLSYNIGKTERVIGKMYGASNRKVFNDRFITQAKIARETSKYEVSMYRLMNDIDSLIAKGSVKTAIEHFEMLSRLEARASKIKADGNALHAGGYHSLSQINAQLKERKQALKAKLKL